MQWVRRTVSFLWPELILAGTPWQSAWEEEQRARFLKVARVFFLVAAFGYISHYYFFDRPNNLQPDRVWFWFRVFIATLCLACFAFYLTSWVNRKWYKWPAAIILGFGCYAQARVTLAWNEAPWIYAYMFVFASVLILQFSALKSLIWAIVVMSVFFGTLQEAGTPLTAILSASFFTAVVATVARSAHTFEIQAFLLTQERDRQRRQIIELQKDFADRLKSFIPRVIASRIQSQMDFHKMSVVEATVNVLVAKRQEVACLFSDIRGFTQGSNNLDKFLTESVLPEVKACSDAIEEFEGIPRKIGDLIFAYFDDTSTAKNLVRASLAGISLSQLNEDMNATVASVNVKRYILISTGEAIVGNIGGMNSGVEITALGPPVNFLSRLDDATKQPKLAELLNQGDVVISSRAAAELAEVGVGVPCTRICLETIGIQIRDFPDEREVFVLKPSQANYEQLVAFYNQTL